MGMNYYLRPKDYEHVDIINEVIKKTLLDIENDYKNTLKSIIVSANLKHDIYREALAERIADVDNIRVKLEWEFDIPEIHVCKLSGGWVPLFEETKYYKDYEGFKKFYNKYKDDFDFVDEYDEKVNIDEFDREVMSKIHEENSHLQFNNLDFKYVKDKYGVEWVNVTFS